MALQPGQQIAHYRIDDKIGEGGMGEVWAATDTRLNRRAAIKSLPPVVAADPERLARFQREAQLLAALNHPNIASIYGLERADDAPYLALELVEGEDLSQHIERGALSHDEALEIALQIASALEEAHGKGIVHRDLKPANIKLTPDGKVKVLDFGLAKALFDDPSSSGSGLDMAASPTIMAASPTITAAMGTQAGMILGTAGYMAPEQARGRTVDKRADVWAFGVILFEMLTGERMFRGETVTDVIAAVVTREPEWDKLPADTPAKTRRVLRRCLQKDPRSRLRDVGDAALVLTEEAEPETSVTDGSVAPATGGRAWALGAAGVVLGLALGWVAWSSLGGPSGDRPTTWVNLAAPPNVDIIYPCFLELSPDGRALAFIAQAEGSDEPLLWVRELDREAARPLEGTEGAYQPFWSPDSRSIGFFAKGNLRRVDIDGGVVRVLNNTGFSPRGGHWAEGMILFVPDWSQSVYAIPEDGGTARKVTTFNEERLELSHRWPFLLPDGKHFLYYIVSTYPALNPDNPSLQDKSGVYLASLDGGEPRLLLTARSRVAYRNGRMFYVDDNVLTARAFDLKRLEFSGQPVPIAKDVTQSVDALWGGALFSVADDGTLMFVRGAAETGAVGRLVWRDLEGNELGSVGEVQDYNSISLSHDGNFVLAAVADPGDIWLYDLRRATKTRFTFDPGNDANPLWSADDKDVLFFSTRVMEGESFSPNSLFRKQASAVEAERLVASAKGGAMVLPTDWSPDGDHVVFDALRPEKGSDVVAYSIADDRWSDVIASSGTEESARFSPDGRWIAYSSDESGNVEVYVQPFPGPGGRWQVSEGGGEDPVWTADGNRIFFTQKEDPTMMVVDVDRSDGIRFGTPRKLFKLNALSTNNGMFDFEVSPDGKRLLILEAVDNLRSQKETITLVQGWKPGRNE